jgi:hypothetical protein
VQTVKMRFRTDNWSYADLKAHGWTKEKLAAEFEHPLDYADALDATPMAQPGDVWRVHWYREGGVEGPLAGYAICCIKCGHVHQWTTANNCKTNLQDVSYTNNDGQLITHKSCEHVRTGSGSCWQWTGSAEDNSLTASPSLQETGSCGFHGFLENGQLKSC